MDFLAGTKAPMPLWLRGMLEVPRAGALLRSQTAFKGARNDGGVTRPAGLSLCTALSVSPRFEQATVSTECIRGWIRQWRI